MFPSGNAIIPWFNLVYRFLQECVIRIPSRPLRTRAVLDPFSYPSIRCTHRPSISEVPPQQKPPPRGHPGTMAGAHSASCHLKASAVALTYNKRVAWAYTCAVHCLVGAFALGFAGHLFHLHDRQGTLSGILAAPF
ncbi:hypothetical protein HOY80DRAFT_1038580 [Tuber brumale]|nr:hypothetical protein HOY80DRAFT_1038580 [Tuber brumale]